MKLQSVAGSEYACSVQKAAAQFKVRNQAFRSAV